MAAIGTVQDSFWGRLSAALRVMRRKKGPVETLTLLRERPALLVAVNVFETCLVASGHVPVRYKYLGQIKTSAIVGCPF